VQRRLAKFRRVREVSYVVGLVGGLFLIAAAVVWWRVYTEAAEAKARAAGIDTDLLRSAAMLTSVALGVSGLAAVLAVTSWFMR
jgi:hypothetical protein